MSSSQIRGQSFLSPATRLECFFKGCENFSEKFKGSENNPENSKGSENNPENFKGCKISSARGNKGPSTKYD